MIILAIFGAYITTVILTAGSLLHAPRQSFIRRTPWLRPNPEYLHFAECRLCVGFWVSFLFACLLCDPLTDTLLIYGASYFLATQER